LKATCGECHPGISQELAASAIHATATGLKTGLPRMVTVVYLWLIGITIGGMLLHNSADMLRYLRNMRNRPYVIRLTLNETLQHWVLALAFIALVVSGFSLRFSEAWWVQILFGWGDGQGFLIRGNVHRTAAVIFALSGVWHAIYLFSHRGRGMLRDIAPGPSDLVNIRENIAYFFGKSPEGARFGRYSYMEKIEYWALIWGGFIMTCTGVMLWFDNFFVSQMGLPKGVLDVVLVVHYYEAWMATLAIIVWHGYATLLNPHVYPMNPAWVSGKMPKDLYTHEHPEGPKLKARGFKKVRYEAEELEDESAQDVIEHQEFEQEESDQDEIES
jgi:cytochrome b subunit of formate dehydrogenase